MVELIKNMEVKKGSISINMIVTLVLLLIGFAILLIFLWQFIQNPHVDREACHTSVIARGTIPAFGGAKKFVPLKCREAKYCITSGLIGGECEDFAGEKDIIKVRVGSKEEISQFLAREILDCWKTMGEGKISLLTNWMFKNYAIGEATSSCTIWSRVAFDKKALQKANIDYENIDLFNYMLTHKPPGKDENYYEYIGESGKVSVKANLNDKDFGKAGLEELRKKLREVEGDGGTVEKNDQLAVVFMQAAAPGHEDVFSSTMSTLAGGAGGSFVIAPFATLKVAGSAAFWKLAIPAFIVGTGIQQFNLAIQRGVTAGYCGDVKVGDEAENGCSVVRVVGYNAEAISEYCSVIESTP